MDNLASAILAPGPEEAGFLIRAAVASALPASGRVQYPFGLGTVDPPADPRVLCAYSRISTRLQRAIEIRVEAVAGYGWKLVPADGFDVVNDAAAQAQFQRESAPIRALLNKPNAEDGFLDVLAPVIMDREAIGNGYLEVTRTLGGQPAILRHVPGEEVAILKGRRGYVQTTASAERRYFKRWGDPVPMDALTGLRADEVAGLRRVRHAAAEDRLGFMRHLVERRWATRESILKGSAEWDTWTESLLRSAEDELANGIPPQRLATELLHFRRQVAGSKDYGIPRWLSAVPAVSGHYAAAMYNYYFFENDACPSTLIVVRGSLKKGSTIDSIEKRFRAGRGKEQHGRVMVVEVDPAFEMTGKSSNGGIDVHPLGLAHNQDANFRQYSIRAEAEISEAFGVPQSFFSLGGTNKATAQADARRFHDTVAGSDRVRVSNQLDRSLVRDGFGAESVDIALQPPKLTDPAEDAERVSQLLMRGAINPRRAMAELGMPAYPDDEEHRWADFPPQIATVMANRGELLPGQVSDLGGDAAGESADGGGDSGLEEDADAEEDASDDPPPEAEGSRLRIRRHVGTRARRVLASF